MSHDHDEPPAKKGKPDDGDSTRAFEAFHVERILKDNSQSKVVFVQGGFADREGSAVAVLEKTPFSSEIVSRVLSGASNTELTLKNDIYHTFDLFPPKEYTGMKATLIYPATEKHVAKYTAQEAYLVEESPNDYQHITLPYIEAECFSIQWVYNILSKKKEEDRIVFEDPDPETGFILLPDMKWDRKQVEDLYLVAIVHKHGIKSLRDLSADSLPLLENILNTGTRVIEEKFNLPASKLRIYLHYQPSYYHLHVHFTHLRYDAPGSGVERAHLLSDVIDCLRMQGDFFQRKTLTFILRQNDKLLQKFKDKGKVKVKVDTEADDKNDNDVEDEDES